jgi:hypothetical protein
MNRSSFIRPNATARRHVPNLMPIEADYAGPLMTIESVKGNQVDCFWAGLDGQPNAESFPIDVLQKY